MTSGSAICACASAWRASICSTSDSITLRNAGRMPAELTLRALGGAALEALHAAARVDELLLAGVERVAVGADLHADLGRGRARRELGAARAAHVGLDVLGMDVGLHGLSSVERRSTPLAGRRGSSVPR